MRKTIFPAVLTAGLLTGGADILLAFLNAYLKNAVTPDRVLRFIASGVFGRQAYTDGAAMILWGLLFHFIIATSFALVFFFIYPRIKWIAGNKILAGILYGIVIWSVMNLVIVPLSNTPPLPFRFASAVVNMAILVVAIGLPLAFLAHKYYSQHLAHETR